LVSPLEFSDSHHDIYYLFNSEEEMDKSNFTKEVVFSMKSSTKKIFLTIVIPLITSIFASVIVPFKLDEDSTKKKTKN
jgi:hypothetical protein